MKRKIIEVVQIVVTSSIISTIISLFTPMIFQIIYPNRKLELYYFGNHMWLWLKYVPKEYIRTGMPFIPWLLLTLIIIFILIIISIIKKYMINNDNHK